MLRIPFSHQKGQTTRLNINHAFSLDRLPVQFATSLVTKTQSGKLDPAPLNDAVRSLVDLICEKVGFRFYHRGTKDRNGDFVYKYHCSQNSRRIRKSMARGKRDLAPPIRFDCGGRLTVRPYLDERTLKVSMVHTYHTPYVNVHLSEAMREFVDARAHESTPALIYRDLMVSELPGIRTINQSQIYYRWQTRNASHWRHCDDQFQSTMMLLSKPIATDKVSHAMFNSGNMRGLAIYVHETMSCLRGCASELAMDATFGTNNAGQDLFAVLAEVGGVGIPIAYCFVGCTTPVSSRADGVPGCLIGVLQQFLEPIRRAGFFPTFFGTDKDSSEIAAIKLVWPDVTMQLCFWHVKRAIKAKLKYSSKTKTKSISSNGGAEPCPGD